MIHVFTKQEWEKQTNLKQKQGFCRDYYEIRFNKIEHHKGYLFGTLFIPVKGKPEEYLKTAFYLTKENIYFVDESQLIDRIRKEREEISHILNEEVNEKVYGFILAELLELLIKDDLIYLQEIEETVADMEEEAAIGTTEENFAHRLIHLKKEISRFYRYYGQLIDFAEALMNEKDYFDSEDLGEFRLFTERAERMLGETERIREYAMQVQEVYHAQMDRKQNDIMKVLTIVTTIFLPLTLIVGWYGMNFSNMPELKWQYGYPMIGVISILVIIVLCIIFKKKKYW